MWINANPIPSATLSQFEKNFSFHIQEPLRSFILEHNKGIACQGVLPVSVGETNKTKDCRFDCFLDFSDHYSSDGAWSINRTLRDKIGDKRIIIGRDRKNNLICLERNYKDQYIVVWSHVTRTFDRCLLDIPAFLRAVA